MRGSVYCVVFSDGTLKAGFTSGAQNKRIMCHEKAGKSFGVQVEVIFFTETHDDANQTEANVLKWLSNRLPVRTVEYFDGGSRAIAREAMLSTGKLVAWANTAKLVDGCFLVPPDSIPESEKKQDSYADRVLSLLRRNNKQGLTLGVIQNRFRKWDVENIINEMRQKSLVRVERSQHPKKKITIERFFAEE